MKENRKSEKFTFRLNPDTMLQLKSLSVLDNCTISKEICACVDMCYRQRLEEIEKRDELNRRADAQGLYLTQNKAGGYFVGDARTLSVLAELESLDEVRAYLQKREV